ncbi:hypothetical protein ACH5AO_23690 [Streptomyces sp. NPDC018964]|uniref:hypothetical protein n=1 Tax=unclassified Streptomyces TaxID=2593676 RepID=UPI0037BBFE88
MRAHRVRPCRRSPAKVLGWNPRGVEETIVATAESQIRLGLSLPGEEHTAA